MESRNKFLGCFGRRRLAQLWWPQEDHELLKGQSSSGCNQWRKICWILVIKHKRNVCCEEIIFFSRESWRHRYENNAPKIQTWYVMTEMTGFELQDIWKFIWLQNTRLNGLKLIK